MRKGISLILAANIINMLFSMLIGFVLPHALSIDEYAYLKTFQLYVAYIGFLGLGYTDGMYLRYGGKDLDKIDGKQLNGSISTMRVFQMAVSLCVLGVALVRKDMVLLAFSFSILPLNLTAYYKYLYQATGEFRRYGNIINLNSVLTTVCIGGVIYFTGIRFSGVYIGIYVIMYLVVYLVLEWEIARTVPRVRGAIFSFIEWTDNIRSGLILMLGNFSSGLLTGIDRWFVKLWMLNADFSYYSFAVSIETVIYTVTAPVMITLYNYICRLEDDRKLKRIKSVCLIFSLYLISTAFGTKFIIEVYLPKYRGSIEVMFLLFAAQIFYFIIKAIYVNCYRAWQMQKTYMVQLVVVLVVAILLNIILYMALGKKEAFAWGTLFAAFLWMVMCSVKIPELKSGKGEWLVLFTSLAVFLLCGRFMNAYVGFAAYVLYITVAAFLFMGPAFKELIELSFGFTMKIGKTLQRKK